MFQRHPIQHQHMMLVTTNTLSRQPIFADPACAREAVEALYFIQERHPFFLYGFVITCGEPVEPCRIIVISSSMCVRNPASPES